MANLSNINNKFLVTTGGNVLIGQTSAVGTAKLQVTGEVRVYTGSNLGYLGVDSGNSYVYLGTNSSGYGLSLQTGGIDRININDAGNVFISTPITNAFYGLSLTYNSNNTADFTVNQATGQIKIGGVATGYFPTFYSAGAERMRIDTSGNATFTGTVQTTQITATNGLNYLKRNTDASLQLRSENTRSGLFITKPATDTVMGSALVLASDESYRLGTANYYHMYMLQNGNTYFTQNVGIGTTSPQRLLHLRSTNQATGIFLERTSNYGFVQYNEIVGAVETYHLGFVNNNTWTSDVLVANELGKVGIGTDSPSTQIHNLQKTNNRAGGIYTQLNGNNYGLSMFVNTGGYGIIGSNGTYTTDVLTMDLNSGNVGIGVTSPSEILQTNKNSAGNIVGGYFTNSQANTGAESVSLAFGLNRSGGDFVRQVKAITFSAEQQWTGTPSTVDGFLSFSTISNENVFERMRITSSGSTIMQQDAYAGITTGLQIFNPINAAGTGHGTSILLHSTPGDPNRGVKIASSSTSNYAINNNMVFYTSLSSTLTERMLISSVGTLDIKGQNYNNNGMAAIIARLGTNCDNTTSYAFIAETGGNNRCFIHGNGNIVNSNNSYGGFSDERLKENIKDATPKLDDLMKVKVKNFNMIGDDSKQIGVVAQELEEIFPSMISENKGSNPDDETLYKGVKYSVFVPMLIKAIQELKADNDSLKARIETLENN